MGAGLSPASQFPEFTSEFRLLLASALHPLQDLEIERLRTCCRTSIEWETFERLVQRHRLIPTVYRNLSRYTASSVPKPVLVRLKEHASQNRQRILQLLTELSHISHWFAQAGIQACSLKGPLLA